MNCSKIWLSSPHMGGDEIKFIQDAFRENWIAPLGPNVTGFEEDLQKYLGEGSHVAALNSGTGALHLALILLGVQHGDEVLCQSMTFAASANVITYVGAKPVFIDSELKTWNICPEALEEAIKNRLENGVKPKAIITVSLYGMPYQTEAVQRISEKYGIPVIEDSAEALGSSYKGRKMGTFGDLSILSFNGNKIITTSGGGALVSRNSASRSKALHLATQAKDDAPHYEHTEIGYNYRMSNICAGIGRGQMQVLDRRVEARRKNNEFYKELFHGMNGITVLTEPDENFRSNHWLSAILIDAKTAGFSREDLRIRLASHEIESRPLWKPMHMQPVFKDCLFFGAGISNQLFENGLCLPSGSNLSASDKERIGSVIAEF